MSFSPIMSGLTTPYSRMTTLLKSLKRGKLKCCASVQAFSAKNVSTLTPSTRADERFSSAIESRRVHISVVHVPLNAAGTNASTTGPCVSSSLSVTGWRSWFGSVKSGAFAPSSAAIGLSWRLRDRRLLFRAFLDDPHLQRDRDLAMQLQRHGVLADRFDGLR